MSINEIESRRPLIRGAKASAEYLGVTVSYFYQVVRYEIRVIKTSPGKGGTILVDPVELDRWKLQHEEVPVR